MDDGEAQGVHPLHGQPEGSRRGVRKFIDLRLALEGVLVGLLERGKEDWGGVAGDFVVDEKGDFKRTNEEGYLGRGITSFIIGHFL